MMLRWFDLCAVFVCGACVMMLEITGFRMFAPFFGYSVYVTGSMISAIMLAMSLGYVLGGWLIDRVTHGRPLFLAVLVAALWVLGLLFGGHWLLAMLQTGGLIQGTLIGALVLFGLPMLFLSMMSPGMIRLLAQQGHVGTTAGQIAALSTVGSILGTLLPSFYVLPTFGVRAALWSVFGALLLIGGVGLWLHGGKRSAAAIATLCLAIVPLMSSVPKPTHPAARLPGHVVLWDVQSPYSRITVVHDTKQDVKKVMPSHFFTQSERRAGGGWTRSELDVYALGGILAAPIRRILLLGVGAGSAYQLLQRSFPDASLVGVDIDAKMIEAGKRFFGLKPGPKGRLVVADARRYVALQQKRYDVIALNLFAGGLYIPFYLATVEFFGLLKKRLQPGGWILMNVVEPAGGFLLSRRLAATAKRALPHVYLLSVSHGNVMLLASRKALDLQALQRQLQLPRWSSLKPVLTPYLRRIYTYEPSARERPLTDDRSALEALTFRASQKVR